MPSVTVDVSVRGGQGMERAIARASDATGLLMIGGHEILAGGEAAFERQGPGWAALAERTQLERARLGFGAAGPILMRTGAYRRNLRGVIDDDDFRLVSDDPRFSALQHGNPATNLPAREIRVGEEFASRAFASMWRALLA